MENSGSNIQQISQNSCFYQIPKSSKSLHNVKSLGIIFFSPSIAKSLVNLLSKSVKLFIQIKYPIPFHQIHFKQKHYILEEVDQICDITERGIEKKNIFITLFLKVIYDFDKACYFSQHFILLQNN